MSEWISTSNALLDSVLSDGVPSGKLTVLAGKSSLRQNSVTHKIYSANYIVLDGKAVKDRTGKTEGNLFDYNLGRLKEVFWDPELGLLELES